MLLDLKILGARIEFDFRLEVTRVIHHVDGRREVAIAEDGYRHLAQASFTVGLAHDDFHRGYWILDHVSTEIDNAAINWHQALFVEDVHLMTRKINLSFICAGHFNGLSLRQELCESLSLGLGTCAGGRDRQSHDARVLLVAYGTELSSRQKLINDIIFACEDYRVRGFSRISLLKGLELGFLSLNIDAKAS